MVRASELFNAAFGLCLSHTEVMQSAMSGHLERLPGRRFMSRRHGGWSLGSIAGLLVGGALSGAAVPVPVQGTAATLRGGTAALLLSRALPVVPARVRSEPDVRLSLPVLGTERFASTLLFVVVSGAMAAVRFRGDAALERFGERVG